MSSCGFAGMEILSLCGAPRSKIYPLSLHDALPICGRCASRRIVSVGWAKISSPATGVSGERYGRDGTGLNSRHLGESYGAKIWKWGAIGKFSLTPGTGAEA